MAGRDVVYVITRGEYSDYELLCACATKEDAQALADRMNAPVPQGDQYGLGACVEEVPVLAADAPSIIELSMSVVLWDDGRQSDELTWRQARWPIGRSAGTPAMKWAWSHRVTNPNGVLSVWGSDHERVRKVYGERKAAFLADDALRAQAGVHS